MNTKNQLILLNDPKQQFTTREQTSVLIANGLKRGLSSFIWHSINPSEELSWTLKICPNDERGCWKIDAYSLVDMINLLPNYIQDKNNPDKPYHIDFITNSMRDYKLSIRRSEGDCLCGTYFYDVLFDAVYDMLLYCVKNNFLSQNYYNNKEDKPNTDTKLRSGLSPIKDVLPFLCGENKENTSETVNAKIRNGLSPVKNVLSLIKEYNKSKELTDCDCVYKTKLLNSILEQEESLEESLNKLTKIE